MTFEVIPAIDVAGGRLVRMGGDGVVPVESFGGDPLAAAQGFVASGARRLHVVDVDLATSGRPSNVQVLRRVAGLGVPVQASGGVRSAAQVDALLEAGADRVVLGSAALSFRDAVESLVRDQGERLCIGIEADGPTIRPRGRGSELPLWDTLEWLRGLPVARFVFTEVGRVSSLAGPDLDGIWALATHTERPVLASGGVRSVDDVGAVAALGAAVEGVIVGRALQEGLDLAAALAIGR
jgi:phosphoribosylformimino-5-aminoimidazole carboxamide ribonucleotide (ProFAR) isomerase